MANLKYAVHGVKVTRKMDVPANTVAGYNFGKGAFLRNVTLSEDRAKHFNDRAHQSGEMYYEVPGQVKSEETSA